VIALKVLRVATVLSTLTNVKSTLILVMRMLLALMPMEITRVNATLGSLATARLVLISTNVQQVLLEKVKILACGAKRAQRQW
jgi:hypothetical protein